MSLGGDLIGLVMPVLLTVVLPLLEVLEAGGWVHSDVY